MAAWRAVNPPGWIEKLTRRWCCSAWPPGQPGPLPKTLEAVQGYTLLRTDRNGWIELTTDGEQMWVEVERR